MRGPVVVVRLDDVQHVGDRVLRQHHAAQHALLGGEVVRRRPLELLAPRHDLRDAHPAHLPCMPATAASRTAATSGERPPLRFHACSIERLRQSSACRAKPSSHGVHRPVDRLCRHAASAVRSLGMSLWKRLWISHRQAAPACGNVLPRLCIQDFLDRGERVTRAISYPHWEFDVQRHARKLCRARASGSQQIRRFAGRRSSAGK